jgi:hypothetical protein
MATRLLHLPLRARDDLLASHVGAHIEHRNRSVLIVTTNVPAAALFGRLRDRGVDTNRVFIVDAVSGRSGIDATGDPEHVLYLPGPQLLELIALRAAKVVRTKAQGPPHILILSINSLALYNSAEALEELVRYTVGHLAGPKVMIEFVVEEGLPLPSRLAAFLDSVVDDTIRLRPAAS